ncbi:sigma 54-interacting transcriptional regulator [Neolewinella sp.]|uniref:sigma 54-interacting transcriptional regulator n=1 Tax=Neolewinella sp. TaxID=2993543 RepID=UPI003B52C4B4
MPALGTLVEQLVETVPLPAFIALHDGTITAANTSLLKVTGQPDLVKMDRSLFGLGIFHNRTELQGFIQSFRDQPGPRRLVLPVGRLNANRQPIVLYASRIEWQQEPALYGVLSRQGRGGGEDGLEHRGGNGNLIEAFLDGLPFPALTVNLNGQVAFLNATIRADLGVDGSEPSADMHRIDAETDRSTLIRYIKQATSRGVMVYETSLQRKDGTLIPVEITMTPLRHAAVPGDVLLTVTEITDRRNALRAQQALEIENAKLMTQLRRRSVLVSEQYDRQRDSYTIITRSEKYKRVLQQIGQVAPTDSTVLITGETGTGKELIARAIHEQSRRASRPMVILNCGALPAELIESELFGYRKGAFTGARTDHLGRFELADEGTLFLDEIGEMPMQLQTRLLRVLQDGEFTPLGARSTVHTDARIVAATNRDLRQLVAEGKFRSDLYFRLNVFPIHSLPLRERSEDIAPLVRHFINKYTVPGTSPREVRDEDMKMLRRQAFPGNIRELENMIQRALIVSDGPYLELELERVASSQATPRQRGGEEEADAVADVLTFKEMQRQHIQRVLALTEGKVSGQGGAAELLALNPQTLFSKMRKLGIDRRGS